MSVAFKREPRLGLVAAADRLDVAPRTVRDWIKTRFIRAVRKNPSKKRSPWLISESEIDRIEEQRGPG